MIQRSTGLPIRGRSALARHRWIGQRITTIGIIGVIGLGAWGVIGLPFFVFPPTGPLPEHADVVLSLGGQTPQRMHAAEQLLKTGTVREMLWSTPPESNRPLGRTVARDCATLAHLICFSPEPGTTRGEARELSVEAARHGWTSAIVVSQTAHLERARAVVGRCFSGHTTMLASGEPPGFGWGYEYLYQTAATVKMWLNPGC